MDEESAGDELLQSIREDSRLRRQAPLAFVLEFLEAVWLDNTYAEALEQWQVKVDEFPWYADDVLACLDLVIAHPPDDLAGLVREHGGIYLFGRDPESGEERPGNAQAYWQWLRDTRAELGRIYDAA